MKQLLQKIIDTHRIEMYVAVDEKGKALQRADSIEPLRTKYPKAKIKKVYGLCRIKESD